MAIEDIIDQLPKSEQFTNNLNALQQKIRPILDDFQKYYVFYNKNPEYPDYQSMFDKVKGQITQVCSDLFTLENNVDANIDKINKALVELNLLIKEEKKKNRELKRKLGIAETENNAASELIDNYTEMYEEGYLRNWGLGISILFAGLIISKVYKSPAPISIPKVV
jgi:6-pyruvoyl-tetrahydropterin synthase